MDSETKDPREPTLPRAGRPNPGEQIYRGLASTTDDRGTRRRVWFVAFLVSAVLHVMLIAVSPLALRRDSFPPSAMLQSPPLFEPELPVLITLVDEPPPPPELSAAPRVAGGAPRPAQGPRQPLEPPSSITSTIPAPPGSGLSGIAVPPAGPPAADPNVDFGGGRGSLAQRLRPGVMDGRLWSLDPEAARFTPTQLAQLRILWAILDMSDSLAAAEAASRALTDWTFTDASGGKWGISEGKLHLGDVTLPLPVFGPAPNTPASQRAWVDAQIERAAVSATARASMNERIKAIRERLDRERRASPPDTVNKPR